MKSIPPMARQRWLLFDFQIVASSKIFKKMFWAEECKGGQNGGRSGQFSRAAEGLRGRIGLAGIIEDAVVMAIGQIKL